MTQGYATEFHAAGVVTDADGNVINNAQEEDTP